MFGKSPKFALSVAVAATKAINIRKHRRTLPKANRLIGRVILLNDGDTYLSVNNTCYKGDAYFTPTDPLIFYTYINGVTIKYIRDRRTMLKSGVVYKCKFGDIVEGYIIHNIFHGIKIRKR